VKSALDIKETARNYAQIDRAIASASRFIDGLCDRTFYPELATKYFDWPSLVDRSVTVPWRLWLGQHEIVSVVSLTSGSVTIPATDYFLEPNGQGPPYDRIELDLSDSSSFGQGPGYQHDIALRAWFGFDDVTEVKGALSGTIGSTVTSITVTDGTIGVWDLLTVDSEKMIVTGKSWTATSDTVNSALTSSMADDAVLCDDGTAYTAGEVIALDSEKMLVVDILGNALVVKRAWDGSTLAAHSSGTEIYAKRTLAVSRAAVGTSAAGHLDGVAVSRQVYAEGVHSYCVALALDGLLQEQSGYSRQVGAGDNAREATGAGLKAVQMQVLNTYGRARSRIGVV
jgi:hypothetical protein